MSNFADNRTNGARVLFDTNRMRALHELAGWKHGKALAAAIVALAAILVSVNFSLAEQLKWTLWVSFGIAALSLSFIWGKAGIFSFGQNALFGIGAYGYAILSLNVFPYTGETFTALIFAAAIAAAFAAALGYFMFYGRVGDVYLSVLTLAVSLILYTVISSTAGPQYRIGQATLGGFNGMPGLPTLAFWIPGAGSVQLGIQGLLIFAIILAALLYVIVTYAADSRFGEILSGVRDNETRMELLGYDVRLWKWLAFVIGGAIAGIGGGLFAAWGMFTNPSVFSLTQAAMVIIWVMVGGRNSLFGAFVGVVIVQWIADEADKIVSQQTPLILGLMLILSLFLLPNGIVPTISKWLKSWIGAEPAAAAKAATARPAAHAAMESSTVNGLAHGVIVAENVTKSFGGLSVLRGVDLTFDAAPIYAIIGPNGAGKSTFFNVLTGRVDSTEGRVTLNGTDVGDLPTFQRARLGLGIKLQIASVFPSMTLRQHIDLALRSRPVGDRQALIEQILTEADLLDRADDVASDLSHGQQQWLEIAMVIAQNPSLILLDEPAAGMSRQEKIRTAKLIERLSASHRIIVVEHDMAFVRSLQSPVAMLHEGRVFRSGSFDAVCGDEEVINIYLGRRSNALDA